MKQKIARLRRFALTEVTMVEALMRRAQSSEHDAPTQDLRCAARNVFERFYMLRANLRAEIDGLGRDRADATKIGRTS